MDRIPAYEPPLDVTSRPNSKPAQTLAHVISYKQSLTYAMQFKVIYMYLSQFFVFLAGNGNRIKKIPSKGPLNHSK